MTWFWWQAPSTPCHARARAHTHTHTHTCTWSITTKIFWQFPWLSTHPPLSKRSRVSTKFWHGPGDTSWPQCPWGLTWFKVMGGCGPMGRGNREERASLQGLLTCSDHTPLQCPRTVSWWDSAGTQDTPYRRPREWASSLPPQPQRST